MNWERLNVFDANASLGALSKWCHNRTSDNMDDWINTIVPYLKYNINKRFNWLRHEEKEDMLITVATRMFQKMTRHGAHPEYIASRATPAYLSYLDMTVTREMIDYIRAHGKIPPTIDRYMYTNKFQLSVEKTIDTKLIIEELPNRILQFVQERNRFQYSVSAIRATIHMLLLGKRIPIVALKNWYHVDSPYHLLSFVVLMSRFFLYKYKDKFANVLDGTIIEICDEIGMKLNIL